MTPAWAIEGAQLPGGERVDLFVEDGRLVERRPPGAEVIDAEGLLVLPGLVDLHTHLREPAPDPAETISSGTRAAARGGYTAVLAMPNTDPVTNGPRQAEWVLDRAARVASAQVVPIGAISVDLAGERLADLTGMAHSRARVRVFSDDGHCLMNAELMRRALLEVRAFDGMIAQHCQDANLAGPQACCAEGPLSAEFDLPGWPGVAESVIVARDVQLALDTGARVHICHVSTAESLEVIRWARARGARVTAEAAPHHLLLQTRALASGDTTFKVNPPLRGEEDVEALRTALADGTVEVVGTDHAPHRPADKAPAFPEARPGMIGLEQALAVVIETMVLPGRIGWAELARAMSSRPAELAGLPDQGQLRVGGPANLTLVHPTRRGIVDREASFSLGRNNPYHGMDLPDPVELTLWAGQVTYRRD